MDTVPKAFSEEGKGWMSTLQEINNTRLSFPSTRFAIKDSY